MQILIQETQTPILYTFKFFKNSTYKNKTATYVKSKGLLKFQANYKNENMEYTFHCNNYEQQGSKNPLIFNPVKWFFEQENKIFLVKSKDNIKLQWKRYKDKYRTTKNVTKLLVMERLLFHTPLGFEYSSFSNGPYLPFFLNFSDINIQEESIIKGMDFILTPINIPVNTAFECRGIGKNIIFLDGWISLDDEKMDILLANKNFQQKAKSYHFSKDFQILSDIKIAIERETGFIHSVYFNLKIKSKNEDVNENMEYTLYNKEQEFLFNTVIKNDIEFFKEPLYKTYKGKSYTKEEWKKFEQEQFEHYARKNNILLEEEKPKKEGRFFLDEKESDL